jgi:hypothetical protein
VSTPDKTDHARGWLYAEGLLLEDEIARLEKTSEAEIDAELRAGGIEPGSVPSLEELLARAGALAKAQEKHGEVDHARGWAHMESLLAEDDGVADAMEARAPVARPAAKATPATRTVRRLRPVWLVAAALGAVLLVFAVGNRAALVAVLKGEEIRPDDEWLPWKPAPTPEERAASARATAFAACDRAQWTTCQAKLDEARAIDPAGETAPRVVAARRALADAVVPLKPEHLKP